MLLIYCATPARLAHKKKEIMDFVTRQGFGPFHPFQAFELERFENGPIGRQKTMEFCLRAIDICDEFWLFGVSPGTMMELDYICEKNFVSEKPKPIRKFLDEFDPNWRSLISVSCDVNRLISSLK